MCSPSAAILGSMQLATSMSAQESQYRMSGIQREANTQMAGDAYAMDKASLLRKADEVGEASAQRQFDTNVRKMEMAALANVMSGESNVEGVSVDAVKNNIERQAGKISVREQKTLDSQMDTIRDEHEASVQRMVARMNGLPPVQSPNLLTTALTIGAQNVSDDQMGEFDSWFSTTFGA